MTIREGAILTAYTGVNLCKDFSKAHEYIEEIMGRPVFTHELPVLSKEIKKKSESDFMKIIGEQS